VSSGANLHVIGRPHRARQQSELHIDLPADVSPIWSRRTELRGLRAFVAVRLGDADRVDARPIEGEDDVAGRDLAHEFVEWVAMIVGVALRRPEIAAASLLLEGLVLVDPPVAHLRWWYVISQLPRCFHDPLLCGEPFDQAIKLRLAELLLEQ
jgi:hypothetical protein